MAEFKVGDTITYYDITEDRFVSREIVAIIDGEWVICRKAPFRDGAPPLAVTNLSAAHPHRDDPIEVGDVVQGGFGKKFRVIGLHPNGLQAWLQDVDVDPSDPRADGWIAALSTVTHDR